MSSTPSRRRQASPRGARVTAAKVAEWADKARDATTTRDRYICAMHDQGASYRDIGKAAGMSHAAIQRIVARRRP